MFLSGSGGPTTSPERESQSRTAKSSSGQPFRAMATSRPSGANADTPTGTGGLPAGKPVAVSTSRPSRTGPNGPWPNRTRPPSGLKAAWR